MRWKAGFALVVLAIMTSPAFAAGDDGDVEIVGGDGIIHCEARILYQSQNCDPERRPPAPMTLDVEDAARVTLTVTWDAVSEDAEALELTLSGNHACRDEVNREPNRPCATDTATGESPLTVTLTGTAASDATLVAFLGTAPTGPGEVRVVRDQPFAFEWRVERGTPPPAPTVFEGEGYIGCRSAAHAGADASTLPGADRPLDRDCPLYPDRGPSSFEFHTGDVERVTFTLEWDAVSPDAERLRVEATGSGACQEYAADPCNTFVAEGTSPLTVTLEGADAQHAWLTAEVDIVAPCSSPEARCEAPYVHVVRDQPLRYTWTYE